MNKIIIPLATGFEEIEAITSIDVLKRAEVNVETVALEDLEVEGAHGIKIIADKLINEVEIEDVAGIVLPGGMPGSTNLRTDIRVLKVIKEVEQKEGLIAAICAAPIVLAAAGILAGRSVTSYPGFESELESAHYLPDRVVRDGNLITAKGPGVTLEFALELIEYIVGPEKAAELKGEMIY